MAKLTALGIAKQPHISHLYSSPNNQTPVHQMRKAGHVTVIQAGRCRTESPNTAPHAHLPGMPSHSYKCLRSHHLPALPDGLENKLECMGRPSSNPPPARNNSCVSCHPIKRALQAIKKWVTQHLKQGTTYLGYPVDSTPTIFCTISHGLHGLLVPSLLAPSIVLAAVFAL